MATRIKQKALGTPTPMDALRLTGGTRLSGSIAISGAKNAALPLFCATLLTSEPLNFSQVPNLADIATLSALLRQHGTQISGAGTTRTLQTKAVTSSRAPYDLVSAMRASILVLGPLLARHGQAQVALPGGCAIGSRPVDLHLRAMEALGARVEVVGGDVRATAPRGGLRGGLIAFPKVSVGATENALMAASLATGSTRLENAACEPEIVDLGELLIAMGAQISGLGSPTLEVEGQGTLGGAQHAIMPDRIEAGTFAVAALITGGDLDLSGARAEHLRAPLVLLEQAGAQVRTYEGGVQIRARSARPQAFDAVTTEYPGFPTDLQAQIMALACVAEGRSTVQETIFENRFMHVDELLRLGADIHVTGKTAAITGKPRLSGARVQATDLRAAAALALAGLAAEGPTHVTALEHLDRGYERFEEKLRAVGATLERVTLSA